MLSGTTNKTEASMALRNSRVSQPVMIYPHLSRNFGGNVAIRRGFCHWALRSKQSYIDIADNEIEGRLVLGHSRVGIGTCKEQTRSIVHCAVCRLSSFAPGRYSDGSMEQMYIAPVLQNISSRQSSTPLGNNIESRGTVIGCF